MENSLQQLTREPLEQPFCSRPIIEYPGTGNQSSLNISATERVEHNPRKS